MAIARRRIYTPEEYLAREEKSEIRHEYIDGEIYAMAGGSANHNLIIGNTQFALRNALHSKPCKIFTEGMRLRIEARNIYTYPDVMVVCGKIEFQPERNDVILNPTLIVEILSKSTRHYDRTDKFVAYGQIPSLQEYVMIDQDRIYIECFRKTQSKLWTLESYQDENTKMNLQSLDVELPISALYEGLTEE